jgi:hypothetical protein
MGVPFESEIDSESHVSDSAVFTLSGLSGGNMAARAGVVNRTHRVVRHRAKVLKERRSHVRSLMVPLAICSALLILTVAAVWSGLFESSEAAGAVQDVTSLAASDAMDHFLVVLLWFVPVSLAVLGTVWFTRFRGERNGEISR